jgi:hypothetical protein
MTGRGPKTRPMSDLRDSGLLWLINRQVFHPRGFALALDVNAAGKVVGWQLLGDGKEPWTFDCDETERLARANETLRIIA